VAVVRPGPFAEHQ